MVRYVPEAADIVWLEFDPQAGHEQKGHRPALVLSPAAYNGKAGLMVCCPLSTQIKGYPFEVLTQVDGKDGVVLSDQVLSGHAVAKVYDGDVIMTYSFSQASHACVCVCE